MRASLLALLLLFAGASPSAAVIHEVDLDRLLAPVSRATLDVDDFANPNPGDDSPFTSWVEDGVTITPGEGEEAVLATLNGPLLGMRFFQPMGFGNGTAVLVFDDPQALLAVEVGFSQNQVRVFLFADAAGAQPLGDIILAEEETSPDGNPLFALESSELFLRAEVQDVDPLGMLLNSNAITDFRFSAVPEPSKAVLIALAGAALTWLRRRR